MSTASAERVPVVARVAGVVIGGAASVAALLWAGSDSEGAKTVADVVANTATHYAIVTMPIAACFGFFWPAWSWRWGLVLSWYAIVAAAFMAAVLIRCVFNCAGQPPLTITVFVGTIALPILPCVAAALGAVLDRWGAATDA